MANLTDDGKMFFENHKITTRLDENKKAYFSIECRINGHTFLINETDYKNNKYFDCTCGGRIYISDLPDTVLITKRK